MDEKKVLNRFLFINSLYPFYSLSIHRACSYFETQVKLP